MCNRLWLGCKAQVAAFPLWSVAKVLSDKFFLYHKLWIKQNTLGKKYLPEKVTQS
jgi:hypothetical protein